jgi:hypothetical protein
MANNRIGSNSSSKSEGKSKTAGNGEVTEPKKTLASRKFIRLETLVWAKLDYYDRYSTALVAVAW